MKPLVAQADTLTDPPTIRSVNGILRAALTITPTPLRIAGAAFVTNLYNGLYAPPTLRANRGDSIELVLTNNTNANQVTNVHYHGMVVTPLAPGDDVFVHIPVSSAYAYQFQVPVDHAEGMFWYHLSMIA
ncbi:MAG: multicopper oxidase domain-containing protein [Gemmatimonadaceae bacterium]|nr:multicopper oxidase domain-containing protein [Gemmatimonadaceae bacterium]